MSTVSRLTPRDKSALSACATDTKRQDRRASHSASKVNDQAKTDRDRSSPRQRDRELRASLGVGSHRSSSATRQGRDQTVRRANVNARSDDATSEDRQSVGEALCMYVCIFISL